MALSLLLQYLVIALAVVVSAWVVLKKQFPGTARKLRSSIALQLVRSGRPPWLQSIGRKVAPPATGSGGACGGCDNCGPTPPKR